MTAHTTAPAFPRRRFLWSSSAAVVSLATAGTFGPGSTADANQLTKEQRDALMPDEIVKRMLAGNERFATGAQEPRDFLAEQRGTAEHQYPAAIAVTCVDSRTPLEVICDLGIGDTFNARSQGMSSPKTSWAVWNLRARCWREAHRSHGAPRAARSGAIDNVVVGHLAGLVAKIQPAIVETRYQGDRASSNPEFVDLVARRMCAWR